MCQHARTLVDHAPGSVLGFLFVQAGDGCSGVRFHLEGGGARAIAGAQERETDLGFGVAGAVELGLTRAVGVELEVSDVTLPGGDPPVDRTLAPRGMSSGQALLAGLRLRPFATSYEGRAVSAAGLWLDANVGR